MTDSERKGLRNSFSSFADGTRANRADTPEQLLDIYIFMWTRSPNMRRRQYGKIAEQNREYALELAYEFMPMKNPRWVSDTNQEKLL